MDSRQRGRSDKETAKPNKSHASAATVSKGNFRKRKRLGRQQTGELVVSETSNMSLEWVNKLVFVQEFERAFSELFVSVQEHPASIEAWFRLIEIAVKIGKEKELQEYLSSISKEDMGASFNRSKNDSLELLAVDEMNPIEVSKAITLKLSKCLLKIRVLEKLTRNEPEEHLINPSLGRTDGYRGSGDVIALGEGDANFEYSAPRSYLGLAGLEAGRRGYLLGKSLRITRSPLVADDYSPELPDEKEIEKFEVDKQELLSLNSDSDIESQIAIIGLEVRELIRDHKDHYAAWYVHGCISELEGQLSQAIESWTQAYRYNPRSLCVLSTLSELQQIGALASSIEIDFSAQFESLDRYAVHGTYETHAALFEEFLTKGEYRLAIASLRTLADWMQKQKGEVPLEIEIICLLGAMKAHRYEGNSGAAESCRREAENLTISLKKSADNFAALAFVAHRAEDFELPTLARMCYFSILTSPLSPKDVVLRVAAHCVTRFPSRALSESLRTAYRTHRGDSEIRFCQVLCALAIENVPVKNYLERKNVIRELLGEEEIGDALSLLQEAVRETGDDPEIHYYLAEIYTRLGSEALALKHYEEMYALDDYNVDSVIRYVQFLLKVKSYLLAEGVAKKLLASGILNQVQEGEVHWALAAAAFAREQSEDARIAIGHALQCDPWNMTFIALALRLYTPAMYSQSLKPDELIEVETLLSKFEDSVLGDGPQFSPELISRWLKLGRNLIVSGHVEFSYLMACALFKDRYDNEDVVSFMCRAGGSFDTRLAAQRLMLLLRHAQVVPPLSQLASCISRIYANSGEWALVGEWIDISLKSGLDDRRMRSKLFELEALKILFEGSKIARARSLVEAALDAYEQGSSIPDDLNVFHGYLMLVQGEMKNGLEKMRQFTKIDPSVQSLYFLVKGLERSGKLLASGNEEIGRLFSKSPESRFEQKLIEEIHMAVGIKESGAIVNLPC